MPLKPDGDCHDLQARTGRRAKLAPSRRPQSVAKGGHWDKVHRRHPRRQPTATSRLTPPSPRFGYSSVAARAGVLGIAGSPSNALKAAVVSRRERINDVGIAMSPIFRADAIFAEPSSDHSTRPERLPATTRKISAITHERIDRCQTPVKVGA